MADFIPTNEMLPQQFEPHQPNRFKFLVSGIPAFMVASMALPSKSTSEFQVHHINNYFNVAGKWTYQPMNVEFYDPITPGGAGIVMSWIRQNHEYVTGRQGYQEQYKLDAEIQQLGPAGDIARSWALKGCWLAESNFGQLNAEDQGSAMKISGRLVYDGYILQYG